MTILLYDHLELEERASRHLRAWKACHLVLYFLAVVFSIVNFVFLQNTMYLVDGNCVLFPRELEFHLVELPIPSTTDEDAHNIKNMTENAQDAVDAVLSNKTAINAADVSNETAVDAAKVKREATEIDEVNANATEVDGNVTVFIGNTTHRLTLDTSRTLFETDSDCQFAEFMPIMSTIIAAVWFTMFTMCPGGGHARTGLQQPWRILTPALLFALVMVALTGHSFTTTNSGLHDFCEAFFNVTNTTTCSGVNPYLERSWNVSWSFGGRVAATKAASAGMWAAWACAAALLFARCLAAPDFVVKRTAVYLAKDPQQKIIPHLKIKSPKQQRSNQSSPTKRDTVSMRSEPTITTELVSASVEPGHDTAPTSLMGTPLRMHRNTDMIEMYSSPQGRFLEQH